MINAKNEIEPLIQAINLASTPDQLTKAVYALTARHSHQAIPTLISVLGYNNPAAAIAAMHGLVALGRGSVPSLLALMDDYNYGARAYTVRALAMIGDPITLPTILHCATSDFAPSVRRAAIKGLGTMHWEWAEVDIDYAAILDTLKAMLRDKDWSIRYAAIVALDALTKLNHNVSNRAIAILEANSNQEPDLSVRFRIQKAIFQAKQVRCL